MSAVSESISIYQEWYRANGFSQEGPIFEAINAGWQHFNSATDPHTRSIHTRISAWVVAAFTVPNAMVERWPTRLRQNLNNSSGSRLRNVRPFETWARPRDLEKRKQAISVWSSLLVFLVFHWHGYGADGALEAMGLHLSWPLKDLVDTIRIYAESGGRFREAFPEKVKEFFILVIMDANATPQTNPLLWWLAMLLQTEVLVHPPGSQLEGVQDHLDFPGQLEAIDHYARVLILDFAYSSWMHDHQSPQGASQSHKIEVTTSLDTVSLDWVDQDQERPPVDILEEFLLPVISSVEFMLFLYRSDLDQLADRQDARSNL
jgi:hypothetical protein